MRLNPDSVRAILLYLENNQKINEPLYSAKVIKNILSSQGMVNGYEDDLLYAIKQLSDDKMIDARKITPDSYIKHYYIYDITPKGHEFLNNIRDDGIWKETKIKALQCGSLALNILYQVAASIISSKLLGS